jgi:mRNA-degrading endonuclease RelE of RelBE toxin-antitoxin system
MINNYIIRFVSAAIREVRKLPFADNENVHEIIKDMSIGNRGDFRKLSGYENLWRTRKNDTRVIWAKINDCEILVVRVGQRKEVYQNICENRIEGKVLDVSNLLGIEKDRIDDIPAYEWTENSNRSWHHFIYNSYLYSPVLTKEQNEVFNKLKQQESNRSSAQNSISSFLVQSSPGTGKTVCAVLVACELHKVNGWDVTLILPEVLCSEVKEFTCVKQELDKDSGKFFVGTIHEWFARLSPDMYAKIATSDEELTALQIAAKRVHVSQISAQDLLLYNSFVYSTEKYVESERNSKHPIYTDNLDRIKKLSTIKTDIWKNDLNDKIPWLDGLNRIAIDLSPPACDSTSDTSIMFFDEAQDYLVCELKAIIAMLNRWQEEFSHQTIICLLGDMNQRIRPVDFDWGQLELNKRHTLKYNYRSTREIIGFANIFHNFALETIKKTGNSWPPKSCDAEAAFQVGESVKILEVKSEDDTSSFLKKLSVKVADQHILNERSLLAKISSKIPLIYTNTNGKHEKVDGIQYFNVEQVKGREFDMCIALHVFGTKPPSFQELNNLYTIFTRPRSGLLVIATSEEINNIGREYFKECDFCQISYTEELEDWVVKYSSQETSEQDFDEINSLIHEGLNNTPLKFYWDTYTAFRIAKISEEVINKIESDVIERSKNFKNHKILVQELGQLDRVSTTVDRTSLKCLILRCLGNSWQAVNEASKIQEIDPFEYYRLLCSIATDLESKELWYEAARVKNKIGVPIPQTYPFYTEIDINEEKDSLTSILCKLAIGRISFKLN